MKKIIIKLFFIIIFLFSSTSFATTYYIDGSIGSDSYDGKSLTHTTGSTGPWKNLSKMESVTIIAGDTIYIRGGIYKSTKNASAGIHLILQNLNGTSTNPIKIFAYNNEKPIFDLYDVGDPTNEYPWGVAVINSAYVHIKGLTIRNLRQVVTGKGISRGFLLGSSNHCTVELLDVYNIAGAGIQVESSNDNLFLNNDSHHNGDGIGDPANPTYGSWNTGDGFGGGNGGDTSTGNVFDGNRMYLNSDDGIDFFDWNGTKVTLRNNWAFWNGVKPWKNSTTVPSDAANMSGSISASMTPANYSSITTYAVNGGNGEGFKLGGHNENGTPNYPDPNSLRKFLYNNVAFENTGGGFQQNMDAKWAHQMMLVNNTSFKNNNDGFGFGVGRSSNPTISHIFKNNLSVYNNRKDSGGDFVFDGGSSNADHNYWGTCYQLNVGNLHPPLQIDITSEATLLNDFVSVDSAGVAGPRQADGSLPNLNFLKLVATSDLIDKGTPINNLNGVTLNYQGINPDLGAFESGSATTPDTTNPIVSFTSPTAGSNISGTVTLSANATDNSGMVARVDFYYGSTFIATDSASPFSVNWNTTTVTDGAYTLNAKAFDAAGNMGATSVNVSVKNTTADTTKPVVSFTTPTNGSTLSGTKTLTATATDNSGMVSKVEFYDGGTLLFSDTTSPYSYNWNTASTMNGSHTLYAKAYDPSNNMQTASVMVTIANTVSGSDTTAPIVNITSMTDKSTVFGTKTITLSASDNTGVVSKVELYDDGALVYSATSAPYSFEWDTTAGPDGNHTIMAKAYDAAGNIGNLTLIVTVSNLEAVDITKPVAHASTSGGGVESKACHSNGASSILLFMLPVLFLIAQRRRYNA